MKWLVALSIISFLIGFYLENIKQIKPAYQNDIHEWHQWYCP